MLGWDVATTVPSDIFEAGDLSLRAVKLYNVILRTVSHSHNDRARHRKRVHNLWRSGWYWIAEIGTTITQIGAGLID